MNQTIVKTNVASSRQKTVSVSDAHVVGNAYYTAIFSNG